MKKIYLLIGISCLFANELEVDGDLTVTGTIQNDSLQQVIADLQTQIATLQSQITILQNQLGLVADCEGVIGGNAILDCNGICNGNNEGCTCIDSDGNEYETVLIGEQVWMAENLKTTHYQNGDPIIDGNNYTQQQWLNAEYGLFAYYDWDLGYHDNYGPLYSGYVVSDSREVCPVGWHVPSDEEWMTLELELGMGVGEVYYHAEWRATDGGVGNKMKDLTFSGNNSSGFSAVGSGYLSYPNVAFAHFGNEIYFWTTTEDDAVNNYNYTRALGATQGGVLRTSSDLGNALSIRCVQD